MNVRDILINLVGKESVSGASKKAEQGLKGVGDEMHDTAKAAKILDAQIEGVQRTLKQLAAQSANVGGGPELRKQIREQERALRDLGKRRKLVDLSEVGVAAGSSLADWIARTTGAKLSTMARAALSPAGLTVGAAIGVPAAAMVGSAVGAAVVGGVGVGGVVGGLVLASKDARVRAAGADLAATVTADLQRSGTRFVGPAIAGVREIQSAWADVSSDVDSVFATSAKYVQPLARGVAGFAREVGPALATAAKAAAPIVKQLAEGMPRIGRAVSDAITDMSGEAQSGATAVKALIFAVEGGIRGVGTLVKWMSNLWEILVKVGAASTAAMDNVTWDKLPIIGGKTKEARDKLADLKRTLEETGETGDGSLTTLYEGFLKAAEGAGTAKAEVESLAGAIDRMRDQNLDARAAMRDLEAAYDAAREAAEKNGKTLDINSEKGRNNAAALDQIVRQAKVTRDAIIATSGTQGQLNETMERAKQKFVEVAVAMGQDAVEAKKLADRLFGIPSVNPKVKVDASDGKAAVESFMAKYREIKNKSVTIQGYVKWTSSGLKVPGGTILEGMSTGGRVGGTGVGDTQIRALDPEEHVLTRDEVRAAGGHAAVEALRKSVLSGRKASTPAVAAMSGGGGGAVMNTYHVTVNVPPTANPAEVGRHVVESIKAYEKSSGKSWRR